MPSPIAHISVGYVIYRCLRSKWQVLIDGFLSSQAKSSGDPEVKPSPPWRGAEARTSSPPWRGAEARTSSPPWRGAVRRGGFLLFLTCILLSLLPDMDCIPALLVGDLKPFHNYYSHSIFVLLAVSIPLAFVVRGVLNKVLVIPSTVEGSRFKFQQAYFLTVCCVLIHVAMDLLGYGRGQMLFWPITDARFKLPFYIFYGLRWSEGWVSVHHVWTILTEGMFAVVIIAATHRYFRHR